MRLSSRHKLCNPQAASPLLTPVHGHVMSRLVASAFVILQYPDTSLKPAWSSRPNRRPSEAT